MSIVTGAEIRADDLITAILSEFDRRQLDVPTAFKVPDKRLWEAGYAAEARRSLLAEKRTLITALDLVKPFLDPLLDQSASGRWDPRSRRWRNTAPSTTQNSADQRPSQA